MQAPGFLKYDLSKIPPKLRRKSNVCAASSSAKFVKKSAPLSIFNEELDVVIFSLIRLKLKKKQVNFALHLHY